MKHRIYPYDKLPVPRLEIRWDPYRGDEPERFKWTVAYELVMEVQRGDIRIPDDDKAKMREDETTCLLRTPLGGTSIGGGPNDAGPDIESAGIDTPYRRRTGDGVHIMRDAAQLRLPAFSCYNGRATQILPIYEGGRWTEEPFDETH